MDNIFRIGCLCFLVHFQIVSILTGEISSELRPDGSSFFRKVDNAIYDRLAIGCLPAYPSILSRTPEKKTIGWLSHSLCMTHPTSIGRYAIVNVGLNAKGVSSTDAFSSRLACRAKVSHHRELEAARLACNNAAKSRD